VIRAGLSLLTTTFTEPKDRNKAFGIYGAIVGTGGAIGLEIAHAGAGSRPRSIPFDPAAWHCELLPGCRPLNALRGRRGVSCRGGDHADTDWHLPAASR
jgi:hypothetical protein